MLYDTIYHVAIAGRTFVVEGNEETARFRWKRHPGNACLEQYVTLFSRIGIVRARFEDGEYRKMMVFENAGGNCNAFAFLLYLCAMGRDETLPGFLRSLALYIGNRPETYRPRVHDWNLVARCAQRGEGLYTFHAHAFAHKYEVPVREFNSSLREADSHRGLRGELGDWTGLLFPRLRPTFDWKIVPPSYNLSSIDDTRVCNIWTLDNRDEEIAHTMLMAHIIHERHKRPDEFEEEEERNAAIVHFAKKSLYEMKDRPLPASWLQAKLIIFDAYLAERPPKCPGYWKSEDGKWEHNVGQRIPTRKRTLTLLGNQMPAERVPWGVSGVLRDALFYTHIVDEMRAQQVDLTQLAAV